MAGDDYELSKHIERFLAALSKLYAQDGKRPLQEIIVNAQTRVPRAIRRGDSRAHNSSKLSFKETDK